MVSQFSFKPVKSGIEVKAKVFSLGNKVWIVYELPAQTPSKENKPVQNTNNTQTPSKESKSVQNTNNAQITGQNKTTQKKVSGQNETTRNTYGGKKYYNKGGYKYYSKRNYYTGKRNYTGKSSSNSQQKE